MLAEEVRTVEQHEAAVGSPDGYRPVRCPRCRHGHMHAHDRRFRRPRGDLDVPPELVVRRFVCAACRAVWTVLPGFLARHLWRVWTTVGVILGSGERRRVEVSPRTRRRWGERVRSCGRRLVAVLAAAGEQLAEVAAGLDRDASRREVVDALGGPARLAPIAGLVDRLAAGVRVM